MIKRYWFCEDCGKKYVKEEDALECVKKHEEYKKEQEKIYKENKKMVFSKSVKLTKSAFDTHGGGVNFQVPKDCNVVILMGNKGSGLRPYQLLLPHQIYVSDLREKFEKEGFEVIVLVPVNSKDYMDVAYRDNYSYERWKGSQEGRNTKQRSSE